MALLVVDRDPKLRRLIYAAIVVGIRRCTNAAEQ